MSRLVVNVKGEGLKIWGADKVADDEIVKRHCEAQHKTRNDAGNDLRKLDLKEGLRGRAAKIKRRLGERTVKLIETGHYRKQNVGQIEGNVRHEHGPEAEEGLHVQKSRHGNEEKHKNCGGYNG